MCVPPAALPECMRCIMHLLASNRDGTVPAECSCLRLHPGKRLLQASRAAQLPKHTSLSMDCYAKNLRSKLVRQAPRMNWLVDLFRSHELGAAPRPALRPFCSIRHIAAACRASQVEGVTYRARLTTRCTRELRSPLQVRCWSGPAGLLLCGLAGWVNPSRQ